MPTIDGEEVLAGEDEREPVATRDGVAVRHGHPRERRRPEHLGRGSMAPFLPASGRRDAAPGELLGHPTDGQLTGDDAVDGIEEERRPGGVWSEALSRPHEAPHGRPPEGAEALVRRCSFVALTRSAVRRASKRAAAARTE